MDLSDVVVLVWSVAASEAGLAKSELIEPDHLFLGALKIVSVFEQLDATGIPEELRAAMQAELRDIPAWLDAAGLEPDPVRYALRAQVAGGDYVRTEGEKVVHRSEASRRVFRSASELALRSGASEVEWEHLFRALLQTALEPPNLLGEVLRDHNVDLAPLSEAPPEQPGPAPVAPFDPGGPESHPESSTHPPHPQAAPAAGEEPEAGPRAPAPPRGRPATPLLDRLGRDLTAEARAGRLREPIGRQKEMLQVAQILARTSKNNPLLLGDAGVGKTAIVEGLAWRIANGRAPGTLAAVRLVQLDMSALVAGTSHRGDFEQRLQGLLREAREHPELILFVDEVHTLAGAGRAEGAPMDGADILKPVLARGEIRLIGATTFAEFRRHIERDTALTRRFQPVMVAEPSVEQTLAILRGACSRLEAHHSVRIAEEALHAAVRLSVRYLPDLRLPDKALDLLEDTCTAVTVRWTSRFPGQADMPDTGGQVTGETVSRVVAARTGILVARLQENERARLGSMPDELKKRVIGQDAACDTVARAVQHAYAGLKEAGRPLSVLLFLGPTGVGKTELAKATGEFLFGSDRTLVRLDMSEYTEKHAVARLIGAPPGYVGYSEEGQLSGALRRNPHSVILLDELEKAHPEVLNLFLQLFDEGRLTDGTGRLVDGTNALFILTSNLTSEEEGVIGFRTRGAPRQALLKHGLRPEFVNRIDEVVVFRSLGSSDLARIVDLLLQQFQSRLQAQEVGLSWTPAVCAAVARETSCERFGARELRRVLRQQVEDPVAGMLLREEVAAGGTLMISMVEGSLVVEPRHS